MDCIKDSRVVYLKLDGNLHVVIIAGGMSFEKEISYLSAERVISALKTSKFNYKLTLLDMGNDVATVLTSLKPDIVFNCLHGTYGEDGCISGLLNIMQIPYTHSGVLASALSFNKAKAKEMFIAHNILTPCFVLVNKSDSITCDPIERPYVIKPISQGSSIGVKVIFDIDNDFHFINYDFPYGDTILVEKYISGNEFQVAVLNGVALGILEVKLLKNRFYDYDSKYLTGYVKYLKPSSLNYATQCNILSIAEKVFKILGCRGAARVELIVEATSNNIFVIEVNTHPGLTVMSSYPMIIEDYGIKFIQFCELLIQNACHD